MSSVLLTRRDMQNAFIHFDIYFRRNFDSIKAASSNIIAQRSRNQSSEDR
ncbi:MAG TPA: hypothetical protein ACFYD9_05880 [Candidatus Wunengus sp. YC64]